MKNTIIKDAIVLFLITLIAGAALGIVHEVTLEPIAIAQQKAANETYREVFPDAAEFTTTDELEAAVAKANEDASGWGYGKVTVDACLEARDEAGELLGYVVNSTSAEGYGGNVSISVGIDKDNKLLGLGFLSLSETAGLGMKAKEPAFRDQFSGKDGSGEIARVKGGNANDQQFNALSGATYTSTAVENALNTGLKFLHEYVEQ